MTSLQTRAKSKWQDLKPRSQNHEVMTAFPIPSGIIAFGAVAPRTLIASTLLAKHIKYIWIEFHDCFEFGIAFGANLVPRCFEPLNQPLPFFGHQACMRHANSYFIMWHYYSGVCRRNYTINRVREYPVFKVRKAVTTFDGFLWSKSGIRICIEPGTTFCCSTHKCLSFFESNWYTRQHDSSRPPPFCPDKCCISLN